MERLHSNNEAETSSQSKRTYIRRQCAPHLICLLGPTRVHMPNSILIRSDDFAQLMAESSYTLQWSSLFPLKIAHLHCGSGPHHMVPWAHPSP